MSADMVVIVPTRARPQSAARLIAAWEETQTTSALVFAVDDDDVTLKQYESVVDASGGVASLVVAPRLRMGPTLNYWARIYAEDHFAVAFMGDDHVPRTPQWDALFLEELRARPAAVVYGNDLYAGDKIPTAVAMTSNIIRVLGFMNPPLQLHLFLDNFWKEVGVQLGCLVYRENIIIEHLHPVAGKGATDGSYLESGATWSHDELMYNLYRERHLDLDIAKLRRMLGACS
jgi:hypothetical protein